MYKINTAKNKLRILTIPMSGTKTATILIMVKTGSQQESRRLNGISHFLEHMFFKGTGKRSTASILSAELDALGSEYNAFTSKEYTGYWIKVASEKLGPAIDILSDMILNSKFEQAEINKEKGVIVEELHMYHENPMMHIDDLFEQTLFGDTPSGWEIVGTKENIMSFRRADFVNYLKTHYHGANSVVCLVGALPKNARALAEKKLAPLASRGGKVAKTKAIKVRGNIEVQFKKTQQANFSFGVPTVPRGHKDEFVLRILAIILGGSMSSRLFTVLREQNGLAYYVRTNNEFYAANGYLTTQAAVPVDKIQEALKIVRLEYERIKDELVPAEELARVKDLIKGRTILQLEETDSVANWYARQACLGIGERGTILSPEEFIAKIFAVTAKDIKRVANQIFQPKLLNLAVIGPYQKRQFKIN